MSHVTYKATLKTGSDINSAMILTPTDDGVLFAGDDKRSQTATVHSDQRGCLIWSVDADLAFPGEWQLWLTKEGDNDASDPDASGATDNQGHIVGDDGNDPAGEKGC